MVGPTTQGKTIVNRVNHLDRGYEAVERKPVAVGAEFEGIERGDWMGEVACH